ncbi:Ferroportin1-domain-containing protein [Xylaria curta]|nr:Ferroportin1-domain-containing protein [Xylaria curta]
MGEQHNHSSGGSNTSRSPSQHSAANGATALPDQNISEHNDEHQHSILSDPMQVLDAGADSVTQDQGTPSPIIPKGAIWRLYVSHFLSTWNSRVFEFAATLFLASIFPGTLRPLSIYALVRNGAAILFAQSMGSMIDRGDRLRVVMLSIVGQRVAVFASCGLFAVLELRKYDMDNRLRNGLFSLTVALAVVEKLCATTNLVSVERDWVVAITEGNGEARQIINARMRRIDLFCKLAGPLAISSIAIASELIAIWVTLGMNVLSVLVECIFIVQVYHKNPSLRRTRERETVRNHERIAGRRQFSISLSSIARRLLPLSSVPFYFRHTAFLPSLALSFLYLTVLSFSGQMITYLISVGYTTLYVGIARLISTIFELSATWIAPRMMKRIGVVRGGLWSISWQSLWLTGGVTFFFGYSRGLDTSSIIPATGLAVAVAVSRVGLWGYDLCAQSIVQAEVESDRRGEFSTVEVAFQNLAELLSYVSTIIFSRPDQFKWPALISIAAVYAAGGLHATFVRKRRGHLVHPPVCVTRKREVV